MALHQVLLHANGPALWPAHKPLAEVLELRATTPELVWSGTYQGTPTPPGGYIFKRSWWPRAMRYELGDTAVGNLTYARYLSYDTAQKDSEGSDYTGCVVGELWADYRLGVRLSYHERLEFPDLPARIEQDAARWNYDGKLSAILVEDKMSGTSALQTLRSSAPDWLKSLLVPFIPTTDKVTRASQAAVWCKNGCVVLPVPDPTAVWVPDFEDELFLFPQAAHDDRVDAFTQLILWLEHILASGREARGEFSYED